MNKGEIVRSELFVTFLVEFLLNNLIQGRRRFGEAPQTLLQYNDPPQEQ